MQLLKEVYTISIEVLSPAGDLIRLKAAVDFGAHAVYFGGKEFGMRAAPSNLSIDEIYEAIWNEDSYNAENIIAVHIRNIREKIEINPKEPKYLKVVWGIGYKIEKI